MTVILLAPENIPCNVNLWYWIIKKSLKKPSREDMILTYFIKCWESSEQIEDPYPFTARGQFTKIRQDIISSYETTGFGEIPGEMLKTVQANRRKS